MSDYLTITPENVREVPLACIIRKKPGHPGIEAKRAWLAERLAEGHVFRKLRDPASCAFIEYAPLETAWVPVEGKNYLYIYCPVGGGGRQRTRTRGAPYGIRHRGGTSPR